jgi:hypothetical protein
MDKNRPPLKVLSVIIEVLSLIISAVALVGGLRRRDPVAMLSALLVLGGRAVALVPRATFRDVGDRFRRQ